MLRSDSKVSFTLPPSKKITTLFWMFSLVHKQLFNSIRKKKQKKFYLHLPVDTYENYHSGLCDNTHFSLEGAALVAQLVVELLKETDLPLVNYLDTPHI
ncbi:hypothetical protein K1Y38_22790 [Serratia marcescens]|nr:hypothetical protein [Serratia marcescens]